LTPNSRASINLSKKFSEPDKVFNFKILTFGSGPRNLRQSQITLAARTPQGRLISKTRFNRATYFKSQRSLLLVSHKLKTFRKMYASGLFPDLGLIDTAVNISLVRKVFPVLGNQDAVDLLIGYAAFCKEKEDRKMRRAFLNRSARLKFFPLTGSPLLVSAVDPLRSPPSKSAERCTPLVTLTKDHIASSLQERYANFPRVMPTEILTLYTDLSYQLRSR